MWVDADDADGGGFKHSTRKGPRVVIVHAGGVAGWVSKTELIFRAKHNSGDYYSEMNSDHFLEWFEHQLCPHIPMGSLIVMDNASYHNKLTHGEDTYEEQHKVRDEGMAHEAWNIVQ